MKVTDGTGNAASPYGIGQEVDMNPLNVNTDPWDDEADGVFFALTATLFAPSYTYGAGVLLASYDPDDEFGATAQLARPEKAAAPVTVRTEIAVSWTRRAQW